MAKKIISLEITDELKELLRIEAFNRRMTVSALIRELLEAALMPQTEIAENLDKLKEE